MAFVEDVESTGIVVTIDLLTIVVVVAVVVEVVLVVFVVVVGLEMFGLFVAEAVDRK